MIRSLSVSLNRVFFFFYPKENALKFSKGIKAAFKIQFFSGLVYL